MKEFDLTIKSELKSIKKMYRCKGLSYWYCKANGVIQKIEKTNIDGVKRYLIYFLTDENIDIRILTDSCTEIYLPDSDDMSDDYVFMMKEMGKREYDRCVIFNKDARIAIEFSHYGDDQYEEKLIHGVSRFRPLFTFLDLSKAKGDDE